MVGLRPDAAAARLGRTGIIRSLLGYARIGVAILTAPLVAALPILRTCKAFAIDDPDA